MFDALALKLVSREVQVGHVDLDRNSQLEQTENVKGVPTIRIYKQGAYYTYHGYKTVSHLMEFVLPNLPVMAKFVQPFFFE